MLFIQDSESEVDVADDFDGSSSGSSLPFYPPAGVVLENMTTYLQENKSIPVDIPQEFLQEHMNTAELHPEETNCQLCPSQPSLNSSLLITSGGTLVTLQGLRKGMSYNY